MRTGFEEVTLTETGLIRLRPSGNVAGGIDLVVLPHPRDNQGLPTFLLAGDLPYAQKSMSGETELGCVAYLPNASDSSLVRLDASDLSRSSSDSALAPSRVRGAIYWWSGIPVGRAGGETALLRVTAPGETDPARLAAEVKVFLRPGAPADIARRSSDARYLARVVLPAGASDTAVFVSVFEETSASAAAAILLAEGSGLSILPDAVYSFEAEGRSGETSPPSLLPFGSASPRPGATEGASPLHARRVRLGRVPGEYDEATGLVTPRSPTFPSGRWAFPHRSVQDALHSRTLADRRPDSSLSRATRATASRSTASRTPRSPSDLHHRGPKGPRWRIHAGTGGGNTANGHLRLLGAGGTISWDLRNQSGREVASGVYLIILEGPGGVATRKVAVIR